MKIRQIDLNLFRVFEEVMLRRSVSEAARELGVTASAVSHALSRLRRALDDELFVFGDSGMEPTPRAIELAPNVREGLGRLASAINARPFRPSDTPRVFQIAMADYGAVVVLPRLVRQIAAVASQIDFRIFPFNRLDVVQQLDEGRVDLVLGWFDDLPERMRRATIVVEREAIIVRVGHPLTQGPITTARLLSYPYVVVELSGSEGQANDGFIDDRGVFRRVWMERLLMEAAESSSSLIGRIAVAVPFYAAVPPLLAVTDMVATFPERMARTAASHNEVVVLELPYEPLEVSFEVVWHRRTSFDPGALWLISELIDVMKVSPDV